MEKKYDSRRGFKSQLRLSAKRRRWQYRNLKKYIEEKAKGILRVEKPNNVDTDILTDPENIVNEAQTSFLKMEASCSYHQETENIDQPTSSSSIAFITEDARRWRRANSHDGRRKMVSELQDNKVNQYQSEGPLKSLSINSDYVSSLDLEIKEECVEPDRLIDVGTPLTATSIQCDGIESSSNEQLKWNSHFVSCESGDDKTNGTATEDYPTPYTTHPNNTPNKTLHFGYNGENKTTSEDLKLHSPISNESLCAISESSKKRKLEDEKDEFDALGINFAAKLRKMSTTQQILAESLMHKVIKFGLLNKLTELTDIIEMDASPDRQLNTKVAVQPTSASASQSRIESITSELQIKVEQIDYSNDAELLNEY